MNILFVSPNSASFITRDIKILREGHKVTARLVRHKNPIRFVGDVRALCRADLLFLWFATVYALPLVILAKILHKPIVTVVGGYEVANEPEIAYGSSRSPFLKRLVHSVLRLSDQVLAVSLASEEEIRESHPDIHKLTKMIYHGFEDMACRQTARRQMLVVNIGHVADETWLKKGIYDFILTAEQMPDIRFVHIGRQLVDIRAKFGSDLPANLTILGEVPFEQLGETLASAKVYLQLSRHESFGCSVAEAMLWGCIPVVANSTALPEVVGDCGIVLESRDISDIAAAVRRALALPDSEGNRARHRILAQFPYERRRDKLLQIINQFEKN